MDPLPLGRCTNKTCSKQCNRWANLICLHCNQGICLEHYEIHQHEIQIRADRLNNQINDLRQILHSLTHQQIIENFQKKLNQWSEKCKNEIDLKHANMSGQLSKEIKQLNIDQFRLIQLNNIDQFIGQPLIDLFRIPNNIQIKHLELLEQQFQQIQKTIEEINSFIQINDQG
jgi:hypothetical protein